MTSAPSEPTDDEMAAVLAAVELVWPQPSRGGVVDGPSPRWRFSGRWWSKPIPSRRDRPH